MKRSLVTFGIVFLLMVSIVSAGVLNYYGKVIGTAQVSPPVFYASINQISGNYYNLYTNILPLDKAGTLSFSDGSSLIFVTDALGVNKWRNADWKVYINVETNTVGNKLNVYLDFIDSTYLGIVSLCSKTLTLDSTANKIYEIVCPYGEVKLSPSDMLQLKIEGIGPTPTYTLYVDGTTKVIPE